MTRAEDSLISAYLYDVTIDDFLGPAFCDDETPPHNEIVSRVKGYVEGMLEMESGHYVLRDMAMAMIDYVDWSGIVNEMKKNKERIRIIQESIA